MKVNAPKDYYGAYTEEWTGKEGLDNRRFGKAKAMPAGVLASRPEIQETHEQVEINTRTSFTKAIMNQDEPITLVQKRSSSTLSSSVAWMETLDKEIVPRPMKTKAVTREGIPAVPTATDGIRWLNDLGFSYSSIAELVGAPIGTIKSIMSGAGTGKKYLEKIQAVVEDADITEDKRRVVLA